MMYSNSNKIRSIELPENLFSNLGASKKPKIVPTIEKTDTEIKVDNNYRDRITNMYNKIDDLTPVNNEIDNILYFNNYVEKGIVIKPKVSSLKQFWTEYRLIKNEKDKENDIPEIKAKGDYGANFDELFNALSVRVNELNSYIDELKEMRKDINESTNKLEKDTLDLKDEKQKFMDYKKEEEEKIAKEKESLKNNYDRLQNIINDLDKKLSEIER